MTVRASDRLADDEEFGDLPFFNVGQSHWSSVHEKQAAFSFDNFLRSREPSYKRTAETVLTLEFDEYVRATRSVVREVRAAGDIEVKQGDVDEETEEEAGRAVEAAGATAAAIWVNRFLNEHEQTARAILARMRGQVDVGTVVSDQIIQEFIRERAEFLAGQVTFTNTEAVLHEVLVGLANQESLDDIVRRVQSIRTNGLFVFEEDIAVPEMDRRTRLIANQESSAIVNGTALRAAQESDQDLRKQWVSQRDNRVRPQHILQDNGRRIPLDQEFDVVGEMSPPSGFNCRCFLLFHEAAEEEN